MTVRGHPCPLDRCRVTSMLFLGLCRGWHPVLEALQGMDMALVGMASFAKCLSCGCSWAPGSFLLLAVLAQQSTWERGDC